MEDQYELNPPSQCPVCAGRLSITRLECNSCGTEVTGMFSLGRLATTPEPHASLLEMFLRVRGNVKEIERELGLSYPTVRARLEEAFEAAGYGRSSDGSASDGPDKTPGTEPRRVAGYESPEAGRARTREEIASERRRILDGLESGELTAQEAASRLRSLKGRQSR
jgi:hypothetical protein